MISPKPIEATSLTLSLNRSKSVYSREIVIRYLSGQAVTPEETSCECEDIEVLLKACHTAASAPRSPQNIYIHQSGTAMRLMTAALASQQGDFVLHGDPQVTRRPIAPLVDALRALGAEISYIEEEGRLPLRIKGCDLTASNSIDTRGWASSQYISALLLIAPMVRGGLRIRRDRADASTPYIDLTIAQMQAYGAEVSWLGDLISVSEKPYTSPSTNIDERDWSSASYWYQLLALHPTLKEISLPHLRYTDSMQGDKVVAQLFEPLGIQTTESSEGIHLRKHPISKSLTTPTIDLSHHPDLFPALALAYVGLGRTVRFEGLRHLSIKESSRIDAVVEGLCALSMSEGISYDTESLTYDGTKHQTRTQPPTIDSHGDHRIAMAFGILGACLPYGIEILGKECVRKSYPAFWDELSPLIMQSSPQSKL